MSPFGRFSHTWVSGRIAIHAKDSDPSSSRAVSSRSTSSRGPNADQNQAPHSQNAHMPRVRKSLSASEAQIPSTRITSHPIDVWHPSREGGQSIPHTRTGRAGGNSQICWWTTLVLSKWSLLCRIGEVCHHRRPIWENGKLIGPYVCEDVDGRLRTRCTCAFRKHERPRRPIGDHRIAIRQEGY